MQVTVGISPGSMHTGISVLYRQELITARILSFRGEWSQDKRGRVVFALQKLFASYSIEWVAVKIPAVLPDSHAFSQVLGIINAICEQKGIKAAYYTLSDIKRQYSKKETITKAAVISHLVHRYPELMPEYKKFQQGSAKYYAKIFEALAAGICDHNI